MRFAVWCLFGFLAACGPYGGPACERYTANLCDICPKNEAQVRQCLCLAEGTLTVEDFPDGSGITNEEAAQTCSRIRYGLQFPGTEMAATCRANHAYLREWDVDACQDLGWRGN